MNVIEPILFHAKFNPLGTAICTPGSALESVTYGRLGAFIHNIGRAASRNGLAAGQTVALLVNDTILHAALAFGLMRAGIAILALKQPQIPGRIAVDAIITDRPELFAHSGRVLRADRSWVEGDGSP